MTKKRYKIAEKVVEINSNYEKVHEYCSDYLTEEPADYSVTVTEDETKYEKIAAEKEAEKTKTSLKILEETIESLAIYRKIAEQMIDYDTLLFHGSAIAVDGETYIFTAPSGTGKSTHTRLWREYLGNKAIMVNDDKPLLKVSDEVIVYGTPYNGKHRLGNNISVPLKAICILTRSKENYIKKISKQEAYITIVQQTYRSNNPEKTKKVLELIDKLLDKVELYKLGCNMNIEAAKIAYEGMK